MASQNSQYLYKISEITKIYKNLKVPGFNMFFDLVIKIIESGKLFVKI